MAKRRWSSLVQAVAGLWLAAVLGGLCVTLVLAIGPDSAQDELRHAAPAVLLLGALATIGAGVLRWQRAPSCAIARCLAAPLTLHTGRRARLPRRSLTPPDQPAFTEATARRYETLFQLYPDAVALIDPDTTIALDCNERMCDILGYSAEELRQLPMDRYRAFDTLDETAAHIRRVLARGSDLFRTVLRTKKGTLRRTLCDLRVIDLDGRELLYLVIRDVTDIVEATIELRALNATLEDRIASRTAELRAERERRRAVESALEAERAVSARILDACAAAILVVSPDDRVRLTNQRAREILGVADEALLGHRLDAIDLRLTDPSGRSLVAQELPLHQIRAEAVPIQGRTLGLERPDGSKRLITVNCTPIPDRDGSVGDVVCCLEDVTREQSLTDSLETAHQRLKALISALPDLIFIIDEDGLYEEILGGRSDLLYGDASFLLGRRISDILPRPVAESLLTEIGTCLAEDRPRTFDYALTVPAGDRHFEASIAPIQEAKERKRRVAVVARDVTGRFETEQSLMMAKAAADEANVAKSRFLAAMSHELRTPLNAILGFTDVLLDRAQGSPDFRKPLEIIHNAGWELLQLIDDILDLSKIEAGKTHLEETSFDLRDLVEGTLTLLRSQAESKRLTLAGCTTERVPSWVWGDPRRIRQILMNIVGNAIKYTQAGRIDVSVDVETPPQQATARADWTIQFTVADTGIGIPPEQVSRIFEVFERGDDDFIRNIAGTGMGLTISKRLVEMMGGRIWLDSTPGQGSRFSFTVRLGAGGAPSAGAPTPASPGAADPTRPAHILIVEDDAFSRQLLTAILEGSGYSLTSAEDGETALTLMDRTAFDLVLLDIQLPGVHGLDLAKLVRSGRTALAPDVPLIATTAFAMSGDRERFLAAGLSDYLSKPVNVRETLSTVRRHLAPGPAMGSPRADQTGPALDAVADTRSPG